MAGRRAKPTAIKKAEGNRGKRKLNQNEPMPEKGLPDCPEYLKVDAKEAWAILAPQLNELGVLTKIDGLALGRLCDCFADVLSAQRLIDRDGETYVAENGLIKANPAVGQKRAADAQLKSYMIEFGLTPASRPKLVASTSNQDEQEKMILFNQYFSK